MAEHCWPTGFTRIISDDQPIDNPWPSLSSLLVVYTAAIVNHVALDLVRDPPIYLCQWKKTQTLSQVETATTTNDSDDNGSNDDDDDSESACMLGWKGFARFWVQGVCT